MNDEAATTNTEEEVQNENTEPQLSEDDYITITELPDDVKKLMGIPVDYEVKINVDTDEPELITKNDDGSVKEHLVGKEAAERIYNFYIYTEEL